jgi:hypothetical protein
MEKRFPRISPLPSRLGLDPEDVDSDVRVVEVDQADLCGLVAVTATLAATATGAGGYEIEFFVAQFNRVCKFMHVTLLCTLLGVDGAVLTATTYPLVGIRQSGCNVA